jgi:predicted acetyltransferase
LSDHLTLIEPSLGWQEAFLAMAREFAATGDPRYDKAISDFERYVARLQHFAQGSDLGPGRVRTTTYWGIDRESIVGAIRLRHTLTPALERMGGHIGYDIRPSLRQRGYGTRLLALTLEQARQRGFERVLITCDSDNIGSVRVIENNVGILAEQGMVDGYDKPISRYWITLTVSS